MMLTGRQQRYIERAAALFPDEQQYSFTRAVTDALRLVEHPMHDGDLLGVLRLTLAAHCVSIGALRAEPRREYARMNR
jgi:hypothetical protein